MGYLTTHILDTTKGVAAANVKIQLFKHDKDGQRQLLHTTITNDDGRCDQPLLDAENFIAGVYELEFAIDDYFAKQDIEVTEPSFLNTIVIRFGISDEEAH